MPFQIIRNDITKVKADAIVNTANPRPVIGGGTDSAIYEAAGAEQLLEERRKIGNIARGDAAVTLAFGLNARYIIHTVGPKWTDGEHGERETLRSCYEKSLALAADLSCESIAFPMISTGIYGFPKDEALEIVIDTVEEFLRTHEMDITLVVFDRTAVELSKKLVGEINEYIDEHTFRSLQAEEYWPSKRSRSDNRRRYFESLEEYLSKKKQDRSSKAQPMETGSSAESSRKDQPFRRDEICADLSMEEAALPDAIPEEDDSFPDMRVIENKRVAPSAAKPRRLPSLPILRKDSQADLEDYITTREDTFQQRLFKLIDERGLKDPDVYKKANVDRKVFSKIRCNPNYSPKKKTAVAFAIALELDMQEMQDLLSRAGFALSPCSEFDLIISYFVEHKKYDINRINVTLFDYGQELLGYK